MTVSTSASANHTQFTPLFSPRNTHAGWKANRPYEHEVVTTRRRGEYNRQATPSALRTLKIVCFCIRPSVSKSPNRLKPGLPAPGGFGPDAAPAGTASARPTGAQEQGQGARELATRLRLVQRQRAQTGPRCLAADTVRAVCTRRRLDKKGDKRIDAEELAIHLKFLGCAIRNHHYACSCSFCSHRLELASAVAGSRPARRTWRT